MRRFQIGVMLVAGLILGWQLMVPPAVGLANNGDFGKVLGYFGVGAPPEHDFVFADTKYDYDRRYRFQPGFYSSELLLAAPALAVNSVLSKDQRFDLRYAGLIHGSLFLLAFGLFVPLLEGLPSASRWALALAALWMFTDVAYASYLNSFYMDAGSYLFLLLAIVFFLRAVAWRRRVDRALALMSVILLVTSKPQHAILAAPLAFLVWTTWRPVWPARGTRLLAAALLMTVGYACVRYGSPPYHDAKGAFNVVFARILPHHRDPDGVLAALGLDASYKSYVGMVAYEAGAPVIDPKGARAFLEHASYPRLGRFFLFHPREAYRAIHLSLSEAGRQRPQVGNFDSGSGMPPWAESTAFDGWSSAKRSLLFHRGTRYLLCFLTLAAALSAGLWILRGDLPAGAVAGGAALVAAALLELLVPALADAMDTPRHFLLFYALCDVLLMAVLYLAVRGMGWTGRRLRPSSRNPIISPTPSP